MARSCYWRRGMTASTGEIVMKPSATYGEAMKSARFALACALTLIALNSSNGQEGLEKIKTIVVIYAENRSFDHLYGFFTGANGIANATVEQKTQLDHDGKPLPHLVVFAPYGQPDPRFPQLPNGPFRIDSTPIN